MLLPIYCDATVHATRGFLPLKHSGIFGICFQAKSAAGVEVNDAFATHFISSPKFQ